ncbi:MAG: AsmA family protein [Neisseria sp.]|uniref:AsmA family protein n=1 Tax=Neisseria sp. TaxID=192066 RepID=UPI0026DD1617|nr:AsmA family protein [Neisseria sp.]MDO4642153.1 AsmA family protein [Neisseria sp.]
MVVSIIAAGLYIALNQVIFRPDRLHEIGKAALAGTGRTLHFDNDISRTWLPRPTVTLRNVTLTGPNNSAGVHLGDMRIGLAWSSLFGEPVIEKWVLNSPDITLAQNAQGVWNLQDLWQKHNHPLRINRLIIENAKIRLDTPAQHTLSHFNLKLSRESDRNLRFQINGRTEHPTLNDLNWKSSGNITTTDSGWQLPDFRLNATANYRNQPINLASTGSAQWQIDTLKLSKITASLATPLYQTNLNATIPTAEWKNGHLDIESINSVLNGRQNDNEWNGTLNIQKINIEAQRASFNQVALNAGSKISGKTGTLSISSPVYWQHTHGWLLPNLKITSRQDQTLAEGGARFISNLSGSFEYNTTNNWQLYLTGLFDRQQATMKMAYDNEQRLINADATLNKLVFTPYLKDFKKQHRPSYPAALSDIDGIQIDAQLNLNNLQLPNLEINHIRSRLKADRNRISLSDFSAELYGGTSVGSLDIENQETPVYHLQQQAKGIQILPLMRDLLRYENLAGAGDVAFDFTTKGLCRKELTQNLNGTLNLKLQKGTLLGININHILKQNVDPAQADIPNTPFNRFTLNSLIQNGIGHHQNAELITDRLYILSSGGVDLNKLTVNENMLITTNNNDAAAHIPLNISGPVESPSVTLNYTGLTHGLSTPEEKQKALTNTLKEQWNMLNKP